MSNNKLNSTKPNGFTIVELLIVIVVIGILAAITIVSYSGITNRANGASAQSNAESIQKVADAYNADPPSGVTGYPVAFGDINGYAGVVKKPSGVSAQSAAPDKDTAKTGAVSYKQSPATGAATGGCIGWWNYGAATPAVWYVAVGTATVTTAALPTACS